MHQLHTYQFDWELFYRVLAYIKLDRGYECEWLCLTVVPRDILHTPSNVCTRNGSITCNWPIAWGARTGPLLLEHFHCEECARIPPHSTKCEQHLICIPAASALSACMTHAQQSSNCIERNTSFIQRRLIFRRFIQDGNSSLFSYSELRNQSWQLK